MNKKNVANLSLPKVFLELSRAGDVDLTFVSEHQVLPLIISSKERDFDSLVWANENKQKINQLKLYFGAILFRGFAIKGSREFSEFIAATSDNPLPYLERTSPRDEVDDNVFTSTSHRNDQEIFLHCEQSYNLSFPQNIYFYCQSPAARGGQTPLADTRKILARLTQETREVFEQRSYQFRRNFRNTMSLTWQAAFQTDSKKEVEAYCRNNEIELAWNTNNAELTTMQTRDMIAEHPVSGDECWFNHCTFFNVKTLDPSTYEVLLDLYSEKELPNQTFYGDGTSIEVNRVDELINAYLSEKVEFEWLAGDVLMVDNMLVAHGRSSFEGERVVLTGMSELVSWDQVSQIETFEL